jgi:serine/threonine protein kinase
MYELIERIAVGGMAEIYLARELDTDGGGYLVVKRILPSFATDRELVDMFLDEQRVAVTLIHPNIVRTYDVGEVNGEYFISMEYLRGEDVRRIFRILQKRREQLPLELALSLVVQAAAGLHYAHEKRGVDLKPLDIVHRDVTPHNLIVTYDGLVKLVDFGVAKAANRQVDTKVGTIKGKIPYMSPEQCKGIELDRRCDIYALGIILYELTTGTRLYGLGGSDLALMRRIVDEPVEPPSERVEGYPLALERIVLKALQKEPEHRYQSAADLSRDLEVFARNQRLTLAPAGLSQFMNENFQSDIRAWEEAAGDISKILERIIARQQDPDTDAGVEPVQEGEIMFRFDEGTSLAMRGGGDDAGQKHLGASLSESLERVWGAADSTPSLPAARPGNGAGADAERAPAGRRGEGQRPGMNPGRTPARTSALAQRDEAGRAPGALPATARDPASSPTETYVVRRGFSWWWLVILIAGMGLAFWLGAIL